MTTVFRRHLVLASAVLALAATGCSNDPTLNGSSSTGANLQFHQVDRLGRGSIVFFSTYAQHDTQVRMPAASDASVLGPRVSSFMTGFGRSGATASAASSVTSASSSDAVLVPDVLVADLSQSGDASFLGYELKGTLNVSCTTRSGSGLFGGRALTDDAATGLLTVALGNAISQAGLATDDGAELDGRAGRANATNDHVACTNQGLTLAQFPYLGAPH